MLAFIHMRKTAGSTLETILRTSFGLRHCGLQVRRRRRLHPVVAAEEVQRCRIIYPRLESISGHGVVPYGNLESVFPRIRYFTFLREPLERCASDYQFRVQRGGLRQPFEEWIETRVARNHQVRQLCGRADAELAIAMFESKVGFVGLLEWFHESLVLWRRWCGCPRLDIRYQSKNVARDPSIKRRLLNNLETRRLLIEANREDLKLYSFACDTRFAQQMTAYGPRLTTDVRAFEAFNIPRPTYPRQTVSMLVRELVYKPLVPWITNRRNPACPPPTVAIQRMADSHRRAA